MKHNLSTLGFLTSAVIGGIAVCSNAQLISYEGFDYRATPEMGAANGGKGWVDPWRNLGDLPTGIADRGLTWPNLETTGRCAFTADDRLSIETVYERTMIPFSPRASMYVSFLFQQFATGGTGGGLFFGDIDNGVTVGVTSRSGLYGLQPTGAMLGADTRIASRLGGTALLVTRITNNNDGTITYSLFVNPDVGSPAMLERLTPDAAITERAVMPISLRMLNDGGFYTDEIRVGLSMASVLPSVTPTSCAADFDANGTIDGADLATLLASWNTPDADLNGDGRTNAGDLAILLGSWGTCP